MDPIPKLIAVMIGTRPEAIKMAPVYRAFLNDGRFQPRIVCTGQHAELLTSALRSFDLQPDINFDVMTPNQSIALTAAKVIERSFQYFAEARPAAVLVQGDTTTAFASGLAAYYAGIPLGHVEAGLRTRDLDNPFPEEANRQMVDRISTWCFAPTETSRDHLLAEQIPAQRISVVGNTGIDALLAILSNHASGKQSDPYVLMTLHRRESFGAPLRSILSGLQDFLEREPEARVLWPVHPNPAVTSLAREVFGDNPRVSIIEPQDYRSFAHLMAESRLILTDSGGVQEEAPSLGKRVLIARDTTERPEAVTTGQNRLIGRERTAVRDELLRAWREPAYQGLIPAKNPYGDGRASQRIVDTLAHHLLHDA